MVDNTASVIATVIAAAILLFFLIWGYKKGFLRLILTTMTFVITIALASILVPYVSHFIADSFIGKSIDDTVDKFIETNVDTMSNKFSKELQDQVIDKLPLPSFVTKDLKEKNTADEYFQMKAKGFGDYLGTRLSSFAVNAVTYLILLVVIYLVIRIVLRIFQVLNRIPIIGGFNRLLGAIVGLAEGLLLIWVACLLVMVLADTPFGKDCLEVIEHNKFLKLLYDNNGIIIGANALFHTFL